MSLRKVFYALPPAWRFRARRIWFWPSDFWKKLAAENPRGISPPPKGMIFTGSGDFERDGQVLVEQFAQHAGLAPGHRVLDIGSGIGRVALPLTRFLDENGAYEGFDVVETGVRWCSENITARFPNFRFRHVPLKNDLYTAGGADAVHFTFPYPDAAFDFACVISVFTHMLPGETGRYLSELHRVLKPGGTVFATFFLLDEDTPPDHNPAFTFPHVFENHALMDKKVQAGNVAFFRKWLLGEAGREGRFLVEKISPGFWSGRKKEACLNFQDVVVLRKTGA